MSVIRSDQNQSALNDASSSKALSKSSITTQLQQYKRTSNLAAPIMHLTGHQAEVNGVKFSPDGKSLASCSTDKSIRIYSSSLIEISLNSSSQVFWHTFGDCGNYLALEDCHKGAVLDLQWFASNDKVVSCGTDGAVCVFELETRDRLMRYRSHDQIVNSVAMGKSAGADLLFASGSDDGFVMLYDYRQREPVAHLEHGYPVLAVEFGSAGSNQLYSAGIDNAIYQWDMRSLSLTSTLLQGHYDSVTCLRLSSGGNQLLSNSFDNTVRVWDLKPYSAVPGRMVAVLEGAPHGFDRSLIKACWSPDDTQIACGAGDRTVVVWNVSQQQILYKLPGHKGTVNEVSWHCAEPIIASCSNDHSIYLGEIAPSVSASYRI